MKKLLLVLAASASMAVSAQTTYSLYRIDSQYSYDLTEYYYNDMMLVDSVFDIVENGAYSYATTLEYDENGNCLKMNDYTFMDDGGRDYTSYLTYTYNDRGQKLTRENYNNFGTGFAKQAKYEIKYNEDGQISGAEIYGCKFSDDYNVLIGSAEFKYVDGVLEEEIYYDYYDDQKVTSVLKQYGYDDKGRRVLEETYIQDGALKPATRVEYTYDENDNIIECLYQLPEAGSWMDAERNVFFYDTEKVVDENTVVYKDPEMDFFPAIREYIMTTSKNAILQQERYIMEDVSQEMVLVDVMDYHYNEHVAVEDCSAVKEVASVEYFNLNGMKMSEPVQGLNIEKTTYSDGTVSVKKIVK